MVKTFEHRPYQARIRDRLNANWGKGVKSQLIISPTGSGKSSMGTHGCLDLVNDAMIHFGCKPEEVGIGWVAMRTTLLDQAVAENDAFARCPNFHPISMFDPDPARHLAAYKARVLVLDEAHHGACATCASIYDAIIPDRLIGLSATPQRMDRADLCFQTTIRDAGYNRLIQEGWLSKFDHYSMDGSFTPERVAATYLADPAKWGKSVIYFLTATECWACEGMLRAAGVMAETVTQDTDCEGQVARFRNGDLDVLLNMVKLTEGFDCDTIKTVWVRDSSNKSAVTQMSGRVLRKHPDLPVKQIVQSLATKFPFTRIAGARTKVIEKGGRWYPVGASDLVDRMVVKMSGRLRDAVVSIPEFIGGGSRKRQGATWPPSPKPNVAPVAPAPGQFDDW